jgi:adenylate kinase
MELNFVMLGPPGAGKGTQALQLRRRWGIPHISTGAILREAVQAGSRLGREVKAIMEAGGLIDDAMITSIVCDRLQQPDTRQGFLLDGFPRTIPQAQSLDGFLGGRPLMIVEIFLSREDVLRRLAARMICSECGTNASDEDETSTCHDCGGPLALRADDAAQVVRNRLDVYHRQTAPLVEYYGQRPTYRRINGAQLPDDVSADIVRTVEALRATR